MKTYVQLQTFNIGSNHGLVRNFMTSSLLFLRLCRFHYFTIFVYFYMDFNTVNRRCLKKPQNMLNNNYLALIKWKQNRKNQIISVWNEFLVKPVFFGFFRVFEYKWWRHTKTDDVSKKFFTPFCLLGDVVATCKISSKYDLIWLMVQVLHGGGGG